MSEIEDWLWRLDRLIDELDNLLPDRSLRVGFSLNACLEKKPQRISPKANSPTCPFGEYITCQTGFVAGSINPETGEISLDLGNRAFPFFVRWDEFSGQDLSLLSPEIIGNTEDEVFRDICLDLCTWHYFEIDTLPDFASSQSFSRGISGFEESILAQCALAPDIVKNHVGGDLSLLGSWPKSLLNLALRSINPTIRAYSDKSIEGKGYPGEEKGSMSLWEREEGYVEALEIRLEPDYYTATKNAIDTFRHIVNEVESERGDGGKGSTTPPGGAQLKIVAALTRHHDYANGSCLNTEPIGSNALAKQAGVSSGSTSSFFAENFGSHVKYTHVCRTPATLAAYLKAVNAGFSPWVTFGEVPGESDPDDE